MPNIVAHMYITSEVYPNASPELVLGSTLRDFVGMAQDYHQEPITPADLNDTVFAEGSRFHQLTDSVFADQPIKKELVDDALSDLRELADKYHGAQWACADPGTELLLDGIILESPMIRALVESMKRYVASQDMVAATGNAVLGNLVSGYFRDEGYKTYGDAEHVATLLQNRLSRRRSQRLAFPEMKIPLVSEAFIEQQARLRIHGRMLLKHTIADLIESQKKQPVERMSIV